MILFILIIILFLVGFPVSFGLGIAGMAGIFFDRSLSLLTGITKYFHAVDSYTLLAIPFFILAGELMNKGKITDLIFDFSNKIVGFIPGGLGQVNILASMVFSGMSGSAVADASGLGRVEIKAMTEKGYDSGFSAAVTAASATIGPIVPPSIPFVIYGVIASVSIGDLFLAGILPGIIMGIALMIICYIRGIQRNYPRIPISSFFDIIKSSVIVFPALLTPVILIGGMISGIFTPTEAAVIASVYAYILSVFFYRSIKITDTGKILLEVVVKSSAILFIVVGASIFSLVLTRMQVPQELAHLFLSLSSNKVILLLMINAFLLFLGCFIDATSALIIICPVLIPLALQMELSLVHFGIIVVLNLMIGLITPPMGVNMFITCEIANISIFVFLKEIWPFFLVLIFVLLLITYVPAISLFIPNTIK